MSKHGPKEFINLTLLNKNKTIEEKSKQKDNNKIKIYNISKNDKKEDLPKIISKKDNSNNNEINNNMLNKKRDRTQSNNKENEEDVNNTTTNNIIKKKMSLNEAKKEMKDFELLILNTEKEIQKKYGFIFPDLSYEDNLPDEIKNKLLDNFLERPEIKKILNEVNSQK